jgi:hypothetical protein
VSGRTLDRLGVVLIALVAALAALIEALLVPLYAGTVVVPVAVVLALVGNVALPRMARSLVPTTGATLVPLALWLAVMLVFLWGRPEGDVAFPSAPTGAEWTFYGVLFGGVIAGIVAVVSGQPTNVRPGPARPPR